MNITNIIPKIKKPKIYEKGTAFMWTDKHISKQLLNVHLNPDIDLGSRKPKTIENTVDWILSHTNKKKLNILDLGCGPGLYAEIFAKKGHNVTGVDFSENSINYAKKEAKRKNLQINYINKNYLKLDLNENQFDLVTLIFTDFGPLLPDEKIRLLQIIRKVLKSGGIFIFDVLNDSDIKSKVSSKNWEVSAKGFWKEKPYIALRDSFLYEKEKVVLYQHIIIDEQGKADIYRFWNHFFSDSDLENILQDNGFKDCSYYKNILPDGDGYKSSDVTFCKAINND